MIWQNYIKEFAPACRSDDNSYYKQFLPKPIKNIPKFSPSSKTRNAPCRNADSGSKLSGCNLVPVVFIKETQDNKSLTVSILPVFKLLNHCMEEKKPQFNFKPITTMCLSFFSSCLIFKQTLE